MKHQLLKFESSQIFKPEKKRADSSNFKGRKIGTNDQIEEKWGAELWFVQFQRLNERLFSNMY